MTKSKKTNGSVNTMAKSKKTKQEPRVHLDAQMAYALHYGWIRLDETHKKLVRELEFCEMIIAARRERDEWNKIHNPERPSTHLITQPCNCTWCSMEDN